MKRTLHEYTIKLRKKEVVFLQSCIKKGAVSPFYHYLTSKVLAIEVKGKIR